MNNKLLDAILVLMFFGGLFLSIGPTIYHFWNFGFEFGLFGLYWKWYCAGMSLMIIVQIIFYLQKRK